MTQELKATVQDSPVPIEGRNRSPEGFLTGTVILTKVGVVGYNSEELNLPGKSRTVKVFRTPETVFHNYTKTSARMKPVTIGHPDGGFVTPENANRVSVGNLGSTPFSIGVDRLAAPIMVTNLDAIDLIEGGHDKSSSGSVLTYEKHKGEYDGEQYEYRTKGPMLINHLAMCKQGRSDLEQVVRLLDSQPEQGESDMDEKQVQDMVGKLLGDLETKLTAQVSAISKVVEKDKAADVEEERQSAMKATFAEMLGEMEQKLTGKIDAIMQSASTEDVDVDATDEGEEEVNEIRQRKEENDARAQAEADEDAPLAVAAGDSEDGAVTARTELIVNALPYLDDTIDIHNMTNREILVSIVGDAVSDSETKGDDYLYGVFDSMIEGRFQASDERQRLTTSKPTKSNSFVPQDALAIRRLVRNRGK